MTHFQSSIVSRRRSPAEIEAEKRLEFQAVGLIGNTRRVPRDFGDNRGAWPVRAFMTANPQRVAVKLDEAAPIFEVVMLRYVWTESERHGQRLKDQLNDLLVGRLRGNWRDLEDVEDIEALDGAWSILLRTALQEINSRESLSVFDEAERQRRIDMAMRRGF